MPDQLKTYVFRPLPSDGTGFLRYNGGNWIPDDGKPDMAFVRPGLALFVRFPHADNILWTWRDLDEHHHYRWHYALINPAINDTGEAIESSWVSGGTHPNTIAGRVAMNKACIMADGVSNGRGPSTYESNEWIDKGLLWTVGSDADPEELIPVEPPANPVCYLCLHDKRGHKLAALRQQHEHMQGEILQAAEEKEKAQSRADEIEFQELPRAYKMLKKVEAQIKELDGEVPDQEEGLADILTEIAKDNPGLDGKPSRLDQLRELAHKEE